MRSVWAETSSHCDMADAQIVESTFVESEQESTVVVISDITDFTDMHQNCCCEGDNCASDCDMGLVVSILQHTSSYAPVMANHAHPIFTSFEVLVRALAPPSRPPAKFS